MCSAGVDLWVWNFLLQSLFLLKRYSKNWFKKFSLHARGLWLRFANSLKWKKWKIQTERHEVNSNNCTNQLMPFFEKISKKNQLRITQFKICKLAFILKYNIELQNHSVIYCSMCWNFPDQLLCSIGRTHFLAVKWNSWSAKVSN